MKISNFVSLKFKSDPQKTALVRMTPEERKEFERDVLRHLPDKELETQLQRAMEFQLKHTSEKHD